MMQDVCSLVKFFYQLLLFQKELDYTLCRRALNSVSIRDKNAKDDHNTSQMN